jgi:hypothetical protein
MEPRWWKLGGDVYPVDADPVLYPDTLPLELPKVELPICGIPLFGELDISNVMPWAMSSSLRRRFSSAKASLSRVVEANVSLRRRTSCSRALMYISLRSRCVLECALAFGMMLPEIDVPLSLPVQLLSSCQSRLAVRLWASSLRWLAICACISNQLMTLRKMRTSCSLLLCQAFKETELCKWTLGLASY